MTLAGPAGRPHMGHMMRHWRERTDFNAPEQVRPFGRERDRGDWPNQRPERL